MFRVFAPLAYSMIGKPLATMLSRSIVIAMKRMPPDRRPEHRRLDRDQGFAELQRKAARWAQDHLVTLREADPDLPVTGRKANCWRPLVAIAELAGADWPDRAREAALALSNVDPDAEDYGIQLLADIRSVWPEGEPSEWTEVLLPKLHEMIERPWCEYGRSRRPITPRQWQPCCARSTSDAAVENRWREQARLHPKAVRSGMGNAMCPPIPFYPLPRYLWQFPAGLRPILSATSPKSR